METFLGRGCIAWAGCPQRVGDRGRGEQTARADITADMSAAVRNPAASVSGCR